MNYEEDGELIKRILATIVFIIIIGVIPTVSSAEAQDNIQVLVNGQNVGFNDSTGYPFFDENNRMLVPLKVTLEEFGATVQWLDKIKVALAEKNGVYIEIPIDKNYILKDGKRIDNDSSSLSKNGRLYLPIRVVMEQFGCNVNWDSRTNILLISSKVVEEQKEATVEEKEKAETNKPQDKTEINERKQEETTESNDDKQEEQEIQKAQMVEIYGSSSHEKETEYKKPVIHLDNDIPEVTDKASFVVSGTCENTEFIIVQSPLNFNTRTKPVNNRFSITAKLVTKDEFRKEKGIGNIISIIAINGDKVLAKEYTVYYNDKGEE
jgi:archaellum component FlaF (FlaF/FlaG flagellin family)